MGIVIYIEFVLGDYRALFTLEIEFSGDTIFFQYLAPRGEAYGKKIKTELNEYIALYQNFCFGTGLQGTGTHDGLPAGQRMRHGLCRPS